jgi:putative nucleotidyltransferase with HDIG domain
VIDLDQILDGIGMLPPLPATSVRLLNVIGDPGASMTDIVEVIKYDQALTSDVLRLCNSAYFGLSRRITSLNEAMVCLGTLKLLQLVMTVHANVMLSGPQAGYDLGPGMLWRQSVATALAAAEIGKRVGYANTNLAFTAGLLHGIGKIVISRFVDEHSSEIIRLVDEDALAFNDAERKVLGMDHTEVGALAAERWKLPEPIVRCIRYQLEPSALDPPDKLVDIVYLANCTTMLMGVALGSDGLSYRADEAVAERNGLSEPDFEAVGIVMCAELQKLAALGVESTAVQNA